MKTGALLVKDNRVISMGYNGTIPGAQHCDDYWIKYWNTHHQDIPFDVFKSTIFRELHHEWATVNEIHGEQNAILYAAKMGISTENTEMYSLYSPCINCAKVIITAGITKVYYKMNYKRDTRGKDFLTEKGVKCIRL
jgi:dCMP deaminase